jgi:hypothetical protein
MMLPLQTGTQRSSDFHWGLLVVPIEGSAIHMDQLGDLRTA